MPFFSMKIFVIIANILSNIGTIREAIPILKTNKAKKISVITNTSLLISSCIWIFYYLFSDSKSLINTILLSINALVILMLLIFKFRHKIKKFLGYDTKRS